jgi:hypothetical protein
MKDKLSVSILVVLSMALTLVIHGQGRRTNRSINVNTGRNQPVNDCADIRVDYQDRHALTQQAELSIPAAQISTLRGHMTTNSGIFISGWDRMEYFVKTCKAVPPDDPNSADTLSRIATSVSGNGELTVTGPNDRDWTANLIVMTPRLTKLDLETRNGPLGLRDVAGIIHLVASNGPIGLTDVGGSVDATTTNGPITVKGASGDQHLTATNGPVHVELSGSRWDGPGLEVSTRNGPLSVDVPYGYGSGISVQASGRSPVSCRAAVCAGVTNFAGGVRLGSGDPVVKLSTGNGPLSIK